MSDSAAIGEPSGRQGNRPDSRMSDDGINLQKGPTDFHDTNTSQREPEISSTGSTCLGGAHGGAAYALQDWPGCMSEAAPSRPTHAFIEVPGSRSRNNSFDTIGTWNTFASEPTEPDHTSIHSVRAHRASQREARLRKLDAHPNRNGQFQLDKTEEEHALFNIAQRLSETETRTFLRFDTLATMCLLDYQHELIKLEEQLHVASRVSDGTGGGSDNEALYRKVRELLREYCKSTVTST